MAKSSCEPQWAWPSFAWFSLLPLPAGLCTPKMWDTEAAPSGCQRQVQKPGKEQYIVLCGLSIQPLFPLPRLLPGAERSRPCPGKHKHSGFTISAFALAQSAGAFRASLQHLKARWSVLHLVALPQTSTLLSQGLCRTSLWNILFSQVPSTQ